jgi:HD-like signal output (HDOD) protein
VNPYLEELLARPTSLPTLPTVVQQVLETFGDPDASTSELGRRISMDPVIAAKLLRLANSAFYRARREVRSVDDALQMLGLTTVRNVVLGCGLKEAFAPVPGLDLQALWQHGVRTASCARWLARSLRLDAEFAFTAGLMQGIGQLLLHKAIPDRVAQINALVSVMAPGRALVEQRALGFHFGEVTAALAERWNLPASLAATLACVPMPLQVAPAQPIAASVHVAGWVVWRDTLLGPPGALDHGDYPAAVAEAIGLRDAWWPPSLDHATPTGLPAAKTRMPGLPELTAGLEELLD